MLLAQDPAARQPAPVDHGLVGRVIDHQKRSEVVLDLYERFQRVESSKPSSGSSPAETRVWRSFPVGTGVDRIPLSPNLEPPNPVTYREDLQKLERYLVWVALEGNAQRDAYARAERKRQERFALIDATGDAFNFTYEAREERGGRTLLRYGLSPRPGYKPTLRNTILFTRVRGTVWIDEQAAELAKIEGTVTEDVSLALFLAKVYKGSHFMQERYEIAPGVWEPTYEQYDFDGRKYLLPFSVHERTFYTRYCRVGPPREAVDVVRAELSKLP